MNHARWFGEPQIVASQIVASQIVETADEYGQSSRQDPEPDPLVDPERHLVVGVGVDDRPGQPPALHPDQRIERQTEPDTEPLVVGMNGKTLEIPVMVGSTGDRISSQAHGWRSVRPR